MFSQTLQLQTLGLIQSRLYHKLTAHCEIYTRAIKSFAKSLKLMVETTTLEELQYFTWRIPER
jgi:hypothetical protein